MNARHFMTAFAALSFIFAISVGTAVADDEGNSDKPAVEKKVEIKVQVRADGNENVEVDGNKIRITLPDGTTKTIDLSELAKGNIKGLEQFHKLGGDKVKIHGKAIIIGPDGKVREIEIDEKNVGHFRATLPKNAQVEKNIEIKVEAQDLEELMKRIKSLESRVKQLEQK